MKPSDKTMQTWSGAMVLLLGAVVTYLFVFHRNATLYKIQLLKNAVTYFIFSKDKNWKKGQQNVNKPEGPSESSQQKTVIFLRHGESTWNYTFNRSKNPIYFIPRIFYSLFVEGYLLLTGVRDSWFYDASLSSVGLEQANELRVRLSKVTDDDSELLRVLKGTSQRGSLLVSSNLRRALSTIIVGLHDRVQSTEEKITVLPQLQEISRNADTLSITPPFVVPHPSWIERKYHLDVPKCYATGLQVELNSGNKHINSVGIDRLRGFNEWLFSKVDQPVVIVSGHSLWFRHFFQEYLPQNFDHAAKTKKIHNGGAVAFTLTCDSYANGSKFYSIDPNSLTEVWKGFEHKSH